MNSLSVITTFKNSSTDNKGVTMLFTNEFLAKYFTLIMMLEMLLLTAFLALLLFLISKLLFRLKQEKPASYVFYGMLIVCLPLAGSSWFAPIWKTKLPLSDNPVGSIHSLSRLQRGEEERLVAITGFIADAPLFNFYGRVFTSVVIHDPATRRQKIIRLDDYQGKLVDLRNQYGVLFSNYVGYVVVDLWHGGIVSEELALTQQMGDYRREKLDNGVLYIETRKGEKRHIELGMNKPMEDVRPEFLGGKHPCTTMHLSSSKNRGDQERLGKLLRPVYLYDANKQKHYGKKYRENVCRLTTPAGTFLFAYHMDTTFGDGNEFLSALTLQGEVVWTYPVMKRRSRLDAVKARQKNGALELILIYGWSVDIITLDAKTGAVLTRDAMI